MREDMEHLRQISAYPDESSLPTNKAGVWEVRWHCRRVSLITRYDRATLSWSSPVRNDTVTPLEVFVKDKKQDKKQALSYANLKMSRFRIARFKQPESNGRYVPTRVSQAASASRISGTTARAVGWQGGTAIWRAALLCRRGAYCRRRARFITFHSSESVCSIVAAKNAATGGFTFWGRRAMLDFQW